jgi:hypothetical protein
MACCPECDPKENIWYMGGGRAVQFTEEVKKRGEQIYGMIESYVDKIV